MGRELLMQNMPNITLMEAVVVCAAVLLLYIGPAVLAWSDARRRRRLQARETRASQLWTEPMPPFSVTPEPSPASGEMTAPVPSPDALETTVANAEVSQLAGSDLRSAPLSEPLAPRAAAAAPSPESAVSAPAPIAPAMAAVADQNDGSLLELQPLDGPSRHCFRLADLHQTRLPDWPPSAIRNDPERNRLWQDAERVAEEHRAVIASAAIWSPYPARSSCLGAAETEGPRARVRFLLFPLPWPVTQSQAVAQAVFEIDRARGEIRGWVDALRESELTDNNRREIRESGGAA